MSSDVAEYRFREEANGVVQVVFTLVIAMQSLVLLQSYEPGIGIAAYLRDHAGALVFMALCAAGVISLWFRETIIRISDAGIEHRTGIGRFYRTRRYPLRDSDARVEVFSFDPWDPHVALHCGDETVRFGWGLNEERLRAIAAEIQERIERQL